MKKKCYINTLTNPSTCTNQIPQTCKIDHKNIVLKAKDTNYRVVATTLRARPEIAMFTFTKLVSRRMQFTIWIFSFLFSFPLPITHEYLLFLLWIQMQIDVSKMWKLLKTIACNIWSLWKFPQKWKLGAKSNRWDWEWEKGNDLAAISNIYESNPCKRRCMVDYLYTSNLAYKWSN